MAKRLKKFKEDICKIIGHAWDDYYICTRCKFVCTYKEFPKNALEIPHRIVMERLRSKFPNLLPPVQKLVKKLKDEERKKK